MTMQTPASTQFCCAQDGTARDRHVQHVRSQILVACRMVTVLESLALPPSQQVYDALSELLSAPDFDDYATDQDTILGQLTQRVTWAAQLGVQACAAVEALVTPAAAA